jgi:hypothetical protein
MKIVLLALLLLSMLALGCTKYNEAPESGECSLPMEFAVRSVCPYAAAEVDGECKVVCYNFPQSENPQASDSYLKQCSNDSECDCSYYAPEDIKGCGCVNDLCAAIVT